MIPMIPTSAPPAPAGRVARHFAARSMAARSAILLRASARCSLQTGSGASLTSALRALEDSTAAPSADALYYLGQPGDEQHQELLQRFAAHPAALAAAVDWDRQTQDPRAGLHLAAWGARWPGADAALQRACLRDLGDQQREQVATALAQQGELDAALNCLGDLRPTAPKTLQWLGLAAEAPLSPEQQAWEQSRSLLLERDWNGAQEALQQQLEQKQHPQH